MIEDMTLPVPQIVLDSDTLRLRDFAALPVDELTIDMRQAKVLDFSGNQFMDLPESLGELFPQARVVFLSGTHMRALPKALAGCNSLEMVGARGSGIETIDVDMLPKSLKALTLTDNNISAIPADISRLSQLEKLSVSGNNIEEVPAELARCRNLEMIRIALNKLTHEPSVLRELPNLAWYTDAGNPFSIRQQTTKLLEIAETRLTMGEEIGKSANNRVFCALLDGESEVAVKVYGAELSADGAVADEVVALQAAQGIEGVVSALGVSRIGAKLAVVMPLVGKEYRQLAVPPDLTQYLRDRYGSQVFIADQVSMLLDKMHRAVEALHANGMMHGDIYAHNLLYSGSDVLLNDFGAASFFDTATDSFRRTADTRALRIFEQEIRARTA